MKFKKYLDLEALTKLRRDLHQHPELGFEEIRILESVTLFEVLFKVVREESLALRTTSRVRVRGVRSHPHRKKTILLREFELVERRVKAEFIANNKNRGEVL